MFDTLTLSEDLAAGNQFTPGQASKLAHALSKATHRDMANKTDIAEVKTAIAESGARLTETIGNFKADTLKWVGGMLTMQAIVVIGAVLAIIYRGH